MVASRLENRVHIYTGDAEAFEIGELFGYAFDIAAEEVVVQNLALFRGSVLRTAAPIVAVHDTLFRLSSLAADIETVHENLVHKTAVQPLGFFIVFRIDRKLPIVSLAEQSVQIFVAAYSVLFFLGVHDVVIEIQSFRRHGYGHGVFRHSVHVCRDVRHRIVHVLFSVLGQHEVDLGGIGRAGKQQVQPYGFADPHRAERLFILLSVREIQYSLFFVVIHNRYPFQ